MMTDSLILDDLEIKNFRTFRHLQIERLGRVNLIVGKNNVGKTALLEALWLYARQGSPLLVSQLLTARDESLSPSIRSGTDATDWVMAIKYLFYGRREIQDQIKPIYIGPINSPDKGLSMDLGWHTLQVDKEGRRELQPLLPEEFDAVEDPILGLTVERGKGSREFYRLDRYFKDRSLRLSPERLESQRIEILCIFTSASGLDQKEIGLLWDNIALTDAHDKIVLPSLRLIAPDIEGVTLVDSLKTGRKRDRIPIVKAKGRQDPIPLRSLGEGMSRIFGIALALTNAKEGLLLIDEIESGLHYTVQPDMWRLIFETARRLNVQVFATTHSWDCIKAFQQAAQENDQVEGVLISLRRKQKQEDEIVAVLLDERQMSIATKEQIEIR